MVTVSLGSFLQVWGLTLGFGSFLEVWGQVRWDKCCIFHPSAEMGGQVRVEYVPISGRTPAPNVWGSVAVVLGVWESANIFGSSAVQCVVSLDPSG